MRICAILRLNRDKDAIAIMAKKTRPINRLTENQANQNARDKKGYSRLELVIENVFRTELAILLEEGSKERDLSIVPAVPEAGQDERYFIGVYEQNKAYILDKMEQRLKTRRLFITNYLAQLDEIIRAKLARGEEVNALPYINFQNSLPRVAPKKLKKADRPKRGKRRKVVIRGKEYESIQEANRQTGLGRRFIQYNLDKNKQI